MEPIRKVTRGSNKKVVWLSVLTLLFLLSTAIVGVSIYIGMQLIKPQRDDITNNPEEYGLLYEDIVFESSHDKVQLHGWWIPAQKDNAEMDSSKTIIFAHGYGNNRLMENIDAIELAKTLANANYDILLFDFRGSGESEGDIVTIGQHEKQDLLSAITYAKQEKGSEEITLLGWSMGAATAIHAGVESEDVVKIIADSPFFDLRDYLEVNLPHWSNLPSFPFTPLILGIMPMLAGVDLGQVSPYQAVKKLGDKDLLLIHSKADIAIPYQNSEKIYEVVDGKAELWLTEEAGHPKSYSQFKDVYVQKVLAFLEN